MNAGTGDATRAADRPAVRSLSRRLVAITLILSLGLSTLITAALLFHAYRTELEATEHRFESIRASMAPSLAESLWFVDSAQTRTLLDGIAATPGVDHVRVETTDGEVLERGLRPASSLLSRSYPLQHIDGETFALGTLRIDSDGSHIATMLKREAWLLALGTTASLLGTALLLLALFRHQLTRHLIAMADYTDTLHFDRLDAPLHLPGKRVSDPPDELDRVAASMNTMRERLIEFLELREAYEQALEEHRDRLEILVRERTAELIERTEQLTEANRAESEAKASAAESAERFADFAGIAADGFWESDAELRLTYVSPWTAQAMGLQEAEMLGRTPEEGYRLRFPDAKIPATFMAPLRKRQPFGGQVLFVIDARGHKRWLMNQGHPLFGADGVFLGYRGTIRDVTAQKRAEKALKDSETRLRLITDNVPALISRIDREHRFTFNNKVYEHWLSRPLSEITGKRMEEVYGEAVYRSIEPYLDEAFSGQRTTFEFESSGRHYRVTYVPEVDDKGKVSGVYGLAHDITKLKAVERELRTLAQFDPLTGLANRRRYDERLVDAIARSERDGRILALMFLDVDRFKAINDGFGHDIGDQVLQEFARRMGASVRQTDAVCRLAGDEFVILLEGLHSPAEAAIVADKILQAMAEPFDVGGRTLQVSTSIGIAVRAQGEIDGDALLRRADVALYAAKAAGRGVYRVAARAESIGAPNDA